SPCPAAGNGLNRIRECFATTAFHVISTRGDDRWGGDKTSHQFSPAVSRSRTRQENLSCFRHHNYGVVEKTGGRAFSGHSQRQVKFLKSIESTPISPAALSLYNTSIKKNEPRTRASVCQGQLPLLLPHAQAVRPPSKQQKKSLL
ncbi:unnamed protein product, partial [Ectocarpus sp. 6 AP-2014]